VNAAVVFSAGTAAGGVVVGIIKGMTWWLNRTATSSQIAADASRIQLDASTEQLNLGNLADTAWRRVSTLEADNAALRQQLAAADAAARSQGAAFEARYGRKQIEVDVANAHAADLQQRLDQLRREYDEWRRLALSGVVAASAARDGLREQLEHQQATTNNVPLPATGDPS